MGSQAIHAQTMKLPSIAFLSAEADVYPRNRPERADEIDAAIGELSRAHGGSAETAILPRLMGTKRDPHQQSGHGVERRDFASARTILSCLNMRQAVSRTGRSTTP